MAKRNKTIGWTLGTLSDGSGDYLCQWVDENHYIEHCVDRAKKSKIYTCLDHETTYSQCKSEMISSELAKRFLEAWKARRKLK